MRNERIEWIGWLLLVVFSANALNAPGAGVFPAPAAAQGWRQTAQDAGAGTAYSMEPNGTKLVAITFPDGTVERFEAAIQTTGIRSLPLVGSLPENSQYNPITDALLVFKPTGKTRGTLGIVGGNDVFWFDGIGSGNLHGFGELNIFNPTRFKYTAVDGTVYILDENEGLISLTDPNGNTLTVTANGVFHSNGKSVLFTRNGDGLVTAVTDPAGKQVTYAYDASKRLVSVTDRALETTTFHYGNVDFPNYLTEIKDPRGISAIRTEFDADGRMVRQTDADGNEVNFTFDTANNRQLVTNPFGDVSIFEYDSRGNVTRSIDAMGASTRYIYDARDNEVSVTNELGFTTTRTFDNAGNQLSETDALGNTQGFSYDAKKRPLSITDELGNVTTIAYSASGNLTSLQGPLGNPTTFTYDAQGNILTTTDPSGTVTSSTYDADGNQLSSTVTDAGGGVISQSGSTYDANGNQLTSSTTRTLAGGGQQTLTTTFEYDDANRVVKTTAPDGSFTQVVYNAIGKVEQSIDAAGEVTTSEYDDRGQLIKTIYPDLTETSTTYDAEGRVLTQTNQLNEVTSFEYDLVGRQIKVIAPDATSTTTVYNLGGQVTSRSDELGNTTSFEYDEAGRQVKVIDALLQDTDFVYDQAGRRTAVTDALSRVTSSEYDEAGRLVKTTFPDTTTATNTYDNATGRLLGRTDQMGFTTGFEYDALGRLTAVIDALNQRTEYEYDEVGAQTVQRDALGRETTYTYDQLGRRVGRTLPDGQSESMTYDVIGNLATRTDFNGHTTTFSYDQMNRLTRKQADAGHPSLAYNHAPKAILYGYDNLGRRVSAESQNSAGQTLYADAWSYDLRGRTATHSSTNGTLSYSYNATGNLAQTQSNHPQGGGAVTYDYDQLNRLTNVYDQNTDDGMGNVPAAAHYAYDGVGNLAAMTYSNGVRHAYTYNTLNRLTQLTVTDALSNVLHSYNHTLNAAGHKTQVVEADGRTVNYAFDQLHRLQSETIAASPGPLGVNGVASYAYDKVSNRISRTSSIAGVANQSLAFNNNDQVDGSGYAYDGNGSTTQAPAGSQDVYSFDNMLIRRVNSGSGLTVDMVYSATGDRVQKVTNGVAVNYLVDTNNHTGYAQVLEETDAAGNLEAVMVYGHDLISQDRSDGAGGFEMSFYSYDGLGSVRGLTDSIGTSLGQYHYDAYGTKIEDTVSIANPYLFAGERFDNDLGLYYLRARYLDVETGRFWSLDDFEGRPKESMTLHKYLYAHANPVSNVDPSGNLTTGELTAVLNTMGQFIGSGLRMIGIGFRILSAAETIGSVINALTLTTRLMTAVMQPSSGGASGVLAQEIRAALGGRSIGDIESSFRAAFDKLSDDWPEISAAIASESGNIISKSQDYIRKNMDGFLKSAAQGRARVQIYLPTAPGPRAGDFPVKIGKKFEIVSGVSGGRLFGMGVRTSKKNSNQIFRIDYWDVREGSKNPFVHYHIGGKSWPKYKIWEP